MWIGGSSGNEGVFREVEWSGGDGRGMAETQLFLILTGIEGGISFIWVWRIYLEERWIVLSSLLATDVANPSNGSIETKIPL